MYASSGPQHRSVPFDNSPTSLTKSIGHANDLFQRSHQPTPCPVLSLMCVPLLHSKHSLEQQRLRGIVRSKKSNAHGRPGQSPEARQQPKALGPDIGHPSSYGPLRDAEDGQVQAPQNRQQPERHDHRTSVEGVFMAEIGPRSRCRPRGGLSPPVVLHPPALTLRVWQALHREVARKQPAHRDHRQATPVRLCLHPQRWGRLAMVC